MQDATCGETSELSKTIASLSEEKFELAQLLAAANESVKEAREAALTADDELDLKEQKLEQILSQLSEREEELVRGTEQVADLESRLEAIKKANNTDDLLEEMEALLEEKLKLEDVIAKEAEKRCEWEEEHKRRMGEEQRLLIQEAETEMFSLRTDRDQLKSALAQSETDVYTVKQENEELLDENKRFESKVLESQKDISSMESELSQLKSVNFDLNIEKTGLSSKIKSIHKERGLRDNKTSEEVVKIASELNRVKAENYEVRQQALDLEDTVQNLENQCEKCLDESQTERKRRLDVEAILPVLEAEIQKLKQRAQEKESANQIQAIANKENAANSNVVKKLQEQVKDMKKETKSKDARIKKLEAVRLTKEQCAVLKKIKVRWNFILYFIDVDNLLTPAAATGGKSSVPGGQRKLPQEARRS